MERDMLWQHDGEVLTRTPLLLDEDPHLKATGSQTSSVTSVLILSTFIAACGSFCYGYAYSIFGSIMTIGGMMGASFSGKITDVLGRRPAMMLSVIACIPGWVAISFAKDALWLQIGRLLIGFGVGLTSYVVPVYIAEITPKHIRGRFTSINMLMTAYGFSVAFFIGSLISWRTLSLIVIPCIVQLIGLFFIPESPRWLAKLGKEKEFRTALQRLRGENVDISQEADDITVSHIVKQVKEAGLQTKNAYPLAIVVGLMILQQLGGNSGLAYYIGTVFTKAGFPTTIGSTSLSIIQIPVNLIALLIMDTFGRRTLLMVSSAGACLSLLLVSVSFHLKELHYLDELTALLVFVGLLGYMTTFAIGMAGIPWILMSEILPIDVKASGGSLVTLTNWSMSWLITYSFNFMLEWSSAATFFTFAAINALAIWFTWKLVPETRGRTLEEIQSLFT
ncbi:Sugar transporter ERD6 [Linum grandiflorum]